MRQPGGKVLVLDGGQPAALTIVRSLGRRRVEVVVGEPDGPRLASRSRYAAQSVDYPDPIQNPDGFVRFIADLAERERFHLIIPVTEDTLQPLAKNRDAVETWSPLAIAPNEALSIVTNKEATFRLAEQLGVPVPTGITVSTFDELESAREGMPFPLVLKPTRSISDNGEARERQKVQYAHNEADLLSHAKQLLAVGPFVLQSYFGGAGVGVELLADHGEVVYAFQHRRLHELPLTGGGSCLRESVPIDPTLLEHSKALMKALQWHGVAMVEFKVDEVTGDARLMEINGRFWGSLPLAVAAGADFPYFLYRLYTAGRAPDAPPAKTGVTCRKLSDDVYWYVQVARPTQDDPLIKWPTRQTMVRDLLLAASPRHHFDVQTFRDPLPGLIDAARTAGWFAERIGAIAKQKLTARHHARIRKRGEVRDQLPRSKSVLFVCYGNINRSALAHVALRGMLDGRGPQLESCGFHDVEGRPADAMMTEVAKSSGIDLSGWSSHTLTPQMIADADLILAMEIRHLERLAEEHPASDGKAYLLSAVTDDERVPLQIEDPYAGSPETYRAVFEQVLVTVEAMARQL